MKVDVPTPFKEKARDMFEADPKIVDLYRLNPNFYEFGLVYSRLNHTDGEMIRELLSKVMLCLVLYFEYINTSLFLWYILLIVNMFI